MTQALSFRAIDIPALFLSNARGVWYELPRALVASGVWALAAVPLASSYVSGAPRWITALALLPLCLASSGLARVSDDLRRGDSIRLRRMAAIDPVLAMLTAVALSLVSVAGGTGGVIFGVGVAGGAVLCLCLPMAFAYGAVRNRQGWAALRGGLLLALHRPGASLSVSAIAVLLGFGVIATGGVLVLVAPILFASLTTAVVAAQLAVIDTDNPSRKES